MYRLLWPTSPLPLLLPCGPLFPPLSLYWKMDWRVFQKDIFECRGIHTIPWPWRITLSSKYCLTCGAWGSWRWRVWCSGWSIAGSMGTKRYKDIGNCWCLQGPSAKCQLVLLSRCPWPWNPTLPTQPLPCFNLQAINCFYLCSPWVLPCWCCRMQDFSIQLLQQALLIDRLFKSTICSCELNLYGLWYLPNVPKDRYRELMRVSQMWRDLLAQTNSWLGHEKKANLQPGNLAIFCPACPQPGINLPKEWDQDPKRYVALTPGGNLVLIPIRWLYTRSIVIDGNFSAEHLKMRQPEGDIALSPGGRYMVEPKRYELHLNTGKEIKQVGLFRKINYYKSNIAS